MFQPTLYHTMRSELEELNAYHLLLQEQGALTDEIYFDQTGMSCCLLEIDCHFTGFPSGYSI